MKNNPSTEETKEGAVVLDPRLKGEKAIQHIKTNFSKELDCAYHILNKGLAIMDHSETVGYDIEIVAHDLITALHTKAHTTFHSIIVLCQKSFDRDALGMVRNLVEILIAILYILQDKPEERAIYYGCEEFRKDAAYIEASRKHFGEERAEQLKKNVQERMNELRPEYNQYLDNINTPRNPFYNVKMKSMAESVGMKMSYEIFYSYLSEFVHPTAIGLKSYTTGGKEKPFTVLPGRRHDKIEEALRGACRFYLDILKVWNSYGQLGKEEDIKKLEERRDRVFLKGSSA